jgi:DNA-binding CsgD family transcriptional regulator
VELSCGQYSAAKALGLGLIDGDGFAMHTRVLPDLVEAAVRDGDGDVAQHAFELLRDRATAAGTPFAAAALARATALTAPDGEADALYRHAIDLFGEFDARGELGRSHLVYGEWLRRNRRPMEARQQLRTAHQIFVDIGAAGFADRAHVELAASGGRARRRTVETAGALTMQERQIAMLAADGLTNAEIGSRLYISAQTVDYHLRKVYRKLDIGSRRQLRGRTF